MMKQILFGICDIALDDELSMQIMHSYLLSFQFFFALLQHVSVIHSQFVFDRMLKYFVQ